MVRRSHRTPRVSPLAEIRKLKMTGALRRLRWATWLVLLAIGICLCLGCFLISRHGLGWLPGIPLLAEGMILVWYLRHDCGHRQALRTARSNLLLGEVLSLIAGEAHAPFKDFRRDHMRHHVEQTDLIGLDLQLLLAPLPEPARRGILWLESLYIPAIFLLVKCHSIWAELTASAHRRRRARRAVLLQLLIYAVLATLGMLVPLKFLGAVILRVHCIRFVDAFQHDYDAVHLDERGRQRCWAYEQLHSFSFPRADRWRFLNLLILNFGLHNAHHALPACPWYRLPRIEQALARSWVGRPDGEAPARRNIGLGELLRAYHRGRVSRILTPGAGRPIAANGRLDHPPRSLHPLRRCVSA